MLDPNAVATNVSRLVQSSPNGRILGSALAVLVKRLHPEFRPEDFGSKNLREFIRKYCKSVFETARKGSDIMYSCAPMPTLAQAPTQLLEFRDISAVPVSQRSVTISTAVWKTFTSPNAFYQMFANRETGEFRVLRKQESALTDPWVQLQPCSTFVHLQIAREFVDGLSNDDIKAQLTKILGLNSWWMHFFVATREAGLERVWSSFRRRRLHFEFEQQIKALGIPPVPVPPPPTSDTALGDQADSAACDDLRAVTLAVIQRLTAAELRDVWLPVGYVLDELKKK